MKLRCEKHSRIIRKTEIIIHDDGYENRVGQGQREEAEKGYVGHLPARMA